MSTVTIWMPPPGKGSDTSLPAAAGWSARKSCRRPLGRAGEGRCSLPAPGGEEKKPPLATEAAQHGTGVEAPRQPGAGAAGVDRPALGGQGGLAGAERGGADLHLDPDLHHPELEEDLGDLGPTSDDGRVGGEEAAVGGKARRGVLEVSTTQGRGEVQQARLRGRAGGAGTAIPLDGNGHRPAPRSWLRFPSPAAGGHRRSRRSLSGQALAPSCMTSSGGR